MAPNSKIQAITFLASIFDLRGCVDLGLGIELDIFIIGVNLTREIQNVFLEASTRFRKHGMRCCLLDV